MSLFSYSQSSSCHDADDEDEDTHVKDGVVSLPLLDVWVLDPAGEVVDHHELQEAGE